MLSGEGRGSRVERVEGLGFRVWGLGLGLGFARKSPPRDLVTAREWRCEIRGSAFFFDTASCAMWPDPPTTAHHKTQHTPQHGARHGKAHAMARHMPWHGTARHTARHGTRHALDTAAASLIHRPTRVWFGIALRSSDRSTRCSDGGIHSRRLSPHRAADFVCFPIRVELS